MPQVAVVTDSTATLGPGVADKHGIVVVPMQVVIGAHAYEDGVDPEASPEKVAAALKEFVPVSTSRPSPATVLETYRRLAAEGADEIVSVHLSAEVSATYESALLAAREAPVPVHAVDTRQVGPGTGHAALAAAAAVAAGASAQEAAKAAREHAGRTHTWFYVDTLEYLRRGGRVSALGAIVGSALAVKPLLQVENGRICPLEKVRTSVRALSRLEDLAVQAAGDAEVDVTVCHLANADAAEKLAGALQTRLADALGDGRVEVLEVPAVIGAHVGPGLVGVALTPR
jgi:DegV family protein with EDD domain